MTRYAGSFPNTITIHSSRYGDPMISEGDYVLVMLDARRTWLTKVERGKTLHTHKGVLKIDDLIGRPYGCKIKSSTGHTFFALKPIIKDFVMKSKRITQIIYPKDLGLIVLLSGVGPGSVVVEAGTGSGALTTVLAYYVRPNGHVYSYDIREDVQRIARENLERAGLLEYVTLKIKDITKGIDEKNVDAVILDMPSPWEVVPHAYESLKPSGTFISYSPTIEQVKRTVLAMKRHKFVEISTMEVLLRDIIVEEGRTRPETRMIGHTGYITFARKYVED